MSARRIKGWLICLLVLPFTVLPGVIVVKAAQAESLDPSRVAVLYPDMREPFRKVFRNMIRGIESQLVGSVKSYPLFQGFKQTDLERWLDQNQIQIVIALGNRGLETARRLPSTRRIVLGALLTVPATNAHRYSGIVLTPDPGILFARLNELAPKVKRVTVVYKPQTHQWIINQAQAAARAQGVALNVLAAGDLRKAAGLYRDFLREKLNRSDALWLLQDDTVLDERAILPFVLKQAWDREFVVLSSNPVHVKRGALFALFPDNYKMGRSLAKLALDVSAGNRNSAGNGFQTLKDLRIAVNMRTAEHLGLKYSSRKKRQFDLVFPSR